MGAQFKCDFQIGRRTRRDSSRSGKPSHARKTASPCRPSKYRPHSTTAIRWWPRRPAFSCLSSARSRSGRGTGNVLRVWDGLSSVASPDTICRWDGTSPTKAACASPPRRPTLTGFNEPRLQRQRPLPDRTGTRRAARAARDPGAQPARHAAQPGTGAGCQRHRCGNWLGAPPDSGRAARSRHLPPQRHAHQRALRDAG